MNIKELKKRKREGILILFLIPLIGFLIYIEGRLFSLDFEVSSSSILFFILVNINIILLLLLVFLVFRNLVKLIAERKRGIIGSKIRTKLVLIFVSFSLLPTIIIFGIAVKFVFSAFNYWFDKRIEQAITKALEVGHFYYQQTTENILDYAKFLEKEILKEGNFDFDTEEIRKKLEEYDLNLFQLYDSEQKSIFILLRNPLQGNFDFKTEIEQMLKENKPLTLIKSLPQGELVYGIIPLFFENRQIGTLVIGKCLPLSLVNKLETVRKSLGDYKQLALVVAPLKISLLTIFSIVTLLLFFIATWVGFHLAKAITTPIQALVAATQKVAQGNLDVRVETKAKDEIGMLVSSFNTMMDDLKAAYLEIERRHKYTETILKNIKTGVISTDASGRITTVNLAAEAILGIKTDEIIGKNFEELTVRFPELGEIIEAIINREKERIEKQIRLKIKDQVLTLLISATLLRDKEGRPLGIVFVFDDITQLEKMQRMAAWREVARRIAHEIKNPLTPIQLSAQRLRRRYAERLGEESIFNECTRMIVKQVEEIKRMVNEFSNFARLPEVTPTLNDLTEVIEEAISVYRTAHPHIVFKFEKINKLPVFLFDREQMKRALLNLLDNAVASIKDRGQIDIITFYDAGLKMVKIEIKDTGEGIPSELKNRLFEPYFSTKKTGTGLGLTIVHTIISDHHGFIRVRDNEPKGTVFVIELPVRR
ncbi:MAG TPA: HAMP domain-containing protein [Candidatus Desulfofervidus auxilii]|uniref:histidine kinase n=1 Tax=Desulfofervidus auxilii TaxID=1621989 RepID=A0A7C0U241_DESA2|nr:HAMP domain-containing protein [Candidatus Desulfofervidus auxilii]